MNNPSPVGSTATSCVLTVTRIISPASGKSREEQTESRIYGGSHYRFDHLAGHQIGRSVAEFVAANVMGPRHPWDD